MTVSFTSYDLQHAADIALFGHLPVPPKVDPSRSEAYTVTFGAPFYDMDGVTSYTEAVAVITRGSQGGFISTVGVYAAQDGVIVGDDETGWVALIDPHASREDVSIEQVIDLLRTEGAVISSAPTPCTRK